MKYIRITYPGHRSSWYNKHIGKDYPLMEIRKIKGYNNFIVFSGIDGTKKGYKIPFTTRNYGKGFDIVHECCGELIHKEEETVIANIL